MKSKSVSRRRFLTVGSLGIAGGVWTGIADPLPVRMVRGWVAEMGRAVLAPRFAPSPEHWNPDGITAAWLGHATVLVNFFGVKILTDPVLFGRIGADTLLGTVGPRRLITPALKVPQLPAIDLVLLSHAHMDHLDYPTLRCFPADTPVVTARGTADLLRYARLKDATELGWGEKTRVTTANGELQVTAFEVNHWGARWKYDKHRGYNGYVIERGGRKIIFGGDTAMTGSFGALRGKGPYDLAIMPIGAYNPWIFAHCSPEQAVKMADQAGADYFAPIHFKTFPFGREGVQEPVERMDAATGQDRIAWRDVGETFRLC